MPRNRAYLAGVLFSTALLFTACAPKFNFAPSLEANTGGQIQSVVKTWTWIDGDTANGINLFPTDSADMPNLAVLGSNLYIAYREMDGGNAEARAMVWDGSQSWSAIDGGATNSNVNYSGSAEIKWPSLVAYNSQLFAVFGENMGAGYMTRAKVWSGSGGTWNAADPNVSPYLSYSTYEGWTMPLVFNGNLYATTSESDGTGGAVRVIEYNSGTSWSFVDGDTVTGIDDSGSDYLQTYTAPQLVEFQNKLYAAWSESGSSYTARVSVYNGGSSWSRVDGGGSGAINLNASDPTQEVSLQSFNGKLYIAWLENNGTVNLIHVKVYNGNDSSPVWTSVDNSSGSENMNSTMNAWASHLLAVGSYLYMAWCEDNTGTGIYQVRVAVYNGDDSAPEWTLVDGGGTDGLNYNPANTVECDPSVGFSYTNGISFINWNNVPYIAWEEDNGSGNYQIHVRMGQ